MKKIKFTLGETIAELGITKNKVAVEAKVRPNTISDMVNNKSSQINFETLVSILHALESLAKKEGIDKQIDIDDVFIYTDGE